MTSLREVHFGGYLKPSCLQTLFNPDKPAHWEDLKQIAGEEISVEKVKSAGRMIKLFYTDHNPIGLVVSERRLKTVSHNGVDLNTFIIHSFLLRNPLEAAICGYRGRVLACVKKMAMNCKIEQIQVKLPAADPSMIKFFEVSGFVKKSPIEGCKNVSLFFNGHLSEDGRKRTDRGAETSVPSPKRKQLQRQNAMTPDDIEKLGKTLLFLRANRNSIDPNATL